MTKAKTISEYNEAIEAFNKQIEDTRNERINFEFHSQSYKVLLEEEIALQKEKLRLVEEICKLKAEKYKELEIVANSKHVKNLLQYITALENGDFSEEELAQIRKLNVGLYEEKKDDKYATVTEALDAMSDWFSLKQDYDREIRRMKERIKKGNLNDLQKFTENLKLANKEIIKRVFDY